MSTQGASDAIWEWCNVRTKQDWNKMCREVCGPRDYLEEHKKRKLKKEKKMEAKYQGEGRKYMGVDMVGP